MKPPLDEERDLDVELPIADDEPAAHDGAEEEVGPAGDDFATVDEPHGEGTEDAYAADLDIGDIDVREEGGGRADDAEPAAFHDDDPPAFEDVGGVPGADRPASDDDHTFHELADDELPSTDDDGGAEGIAAGGEVDVDEAALPALDADADGEVELDDMLKQLGFGASEPEPWEPAEGLSFEADLAAVASEDGCVAAVGAALVVIGKGEIAPRARMLAEVAHACAWDGSRIAFATARGVHSVVGTAEDALVYVRSGVRAVTAAAGRLWALAGRDLVGIDVASGSDVTARSDVAALAGAAGTLFVAIEAEGGGPLKLLRLRGQDGDWEEIRGRDDIAALIARGARLCINGANAMATLEGGRVHVQRPGDPAPSIASIERVAAIAFRGDHAAAPLLAVLEDGQLGCIEESGGFLELGLVPARSPRALAWDGTRELLFVAGPDGLVAMGPRVRH